jgi:HSP20 family protein
MEDRFMLTLDLLKEVDRLQDQVNSLFTGGPSGLATTSEAPALNVWSGEDTLHVTAELPGIDPEKIDVAVRGDELTLRGSFAERELKEGERWIRQERAPYAFVRTLRLPFRVESDKVSAEYKNGILSLTLPRAEAERPQRIQIKAGEANHANQ